MSPKVQANSNKDPQLYSDQDLAYSLAPVYDWIEIAPGQGGSGTMVPLNDNAENQEDIATVVLPFDFGFYGEDYDRISICSNGYIGLGESESALFRNYPIPGPMEAFCLLRVKLTAHQSPQ